MNDFTKEELFDLKNVTDIPETLQLKIHNLSATTDKILKLFAIKAELSIDEILVGLYRKYKIERSRNWISATLYNLKKRDYILKVNGKKGVYKLNE